MRPHGWRYILGCLVGVCATCTDSNAHNERQSLPLIILESTDVIAEPNPENSANCKWLGRMMVLLVFAVQIFATLVLLSRRVIIVGIGQSPVNVHCFVCTVGGLVVAIESLVQSI